MSQVETAACRRSYGVPARGPAATSRASIDRARDLLASAGAAQPGELAPWCTPGYIAVHEAAGQMWLGDPGRAAAGYTQALTDWPAEFRRDEGIYRARLARAHAAAGNPEEAATAGQRALSLAGRTGSARILTELSFLPADLSRWASLPLVKTFATDLTQVVSTHSRPTNIEVVFTPSKYDPETKAKAVRLVLDHRDDYPSEWAAITTVSSRLGMNAETLRSWVSQAQVDAGQRDGASSETAAEIRELTETVDILKAVSFFARESDPRSHR